MLEDIVKKLKIDEIKRHIFLCADQTNAKCCQKELGLKSWNYLKDRIKELQLDQIGVFRTKANCLRVCSLSSILKGFSTASKIIDKY